ncbi:SDR family oxidoreductase [Pleionea sediminis]|uniref:SDR family oxidoreductase n=1 Tax=Pleionea sediminis TaxID=2569479 RepID=UPI001FEA7215|nr:NAD(P)-dependent oxidoreductase [Pleionea sediminis]
MSLSNKTIVITGASRGIGRALALRFAKDGANVVIAAKSSEPHPKLGGSIHSVAEEVEQAGGKALAYQLDVRKELQVKKLMKTTAETFGGIDAIINNAGAISLTSVESTSPKRYDLMQTVNHRAVYCMAHYAIPYLRKSKHAHILNLSPPLNLDIKWLKDYSPYTLSKYGMSMLTLGLAEELRNDKIAVNSLWPETMIATAAIEFAVADQSALQHCRKPEIMADAAYEVLTTQNNELTGQLLLDESILRERGTKEFEHYAVNPEKDLYPDLFID